MEENKTIGMEKSAKKNSYVGIIVLLIVTIIALASYNVYDLFNSNNRVTGSEKCKKCSRSTNKCQNVNENNSVPVEDTYAMSIAPDIGFNFYLLKEGSLYYKIGNIDDYESEMEGRYFFQYSPFRLKAGNTETNELTKYDKVNNIKRIKSVNLSCGFSFFLFLITEEGKVYELTHDGDQFILENKIFKDYQVEDIVSYSVGCDVEVEDSFKILLKNGKTIEKTNDGKITEK